MKTTEYALNSPITTVEKRGIDKRNCNLLFIGYWCTSSAKVRQKAL